MLHTLFRVIYRMSDKGIPVYPFRVILRMRVQINFRVNSNNPSEKRHKALKMKIEAPFTAQRHAQ
jgi:hypothetical protein